MPGDDLNDPNFVTKLDHDEGFKEIDVEFKNGDVRKVKVNSIAPRHYIRLQQEWKRLADKAEADGQDWLDMLARAAAPDVDLTKLTITSHQLVCAAAHFLAIGITAQKKIVEAYAKLSESLQSSSLTKSSTSKPSLSATGGTKPASATSPSASSKTSPPKRASKNSKT